MQEHEGAHNTEHLTGWLTHLSRFRPWSWCRARRYSSTEVSEEAKNHGASANVFEKRNNLQRDLVMLETTRETAHAVKNINTTALHKLFEVLDAIKAKGVLSKTKLEIRGEKEGHCSLDAACVEDCEACIQGRGTIRCQHTLPNTSAAQDLHEYLNGKGK